MTQSASVVYAAHGFGENILDTLYDLQQSAKFCDLRLDAKNGCVHIHSLILLANSNFFQTWLQHESCESELSYKIPDLTVEELQGIIEFLYTGRLVINADTVCSYMTFFEKLAIEEAVSLCHEFITRRRSREMVIDKDVRGGSGNTERDDIHVSGRQVVSSFTKNTVREMGENSHEYVKMQYNDSESNDDSGTAMPTDVPQSDVSKCFPSNNQVVTEEKLIVSQSFVKLEKLDDGFTDFKNVDSFEEKPSQEKEKQSASMLSFSTACDAELAVPTVKKKRGRPSGKCTERKNTFKLRARGRKMTAKGKMKKKNYLKCKLRQVIMTKTSDTDDVDNEEIKTELSLSEPKKKHKKMCSRRQTYSRKYSCEFCGHKAIRFVELESHRHSKHDVPFDPTKYTVYKCEICNFETNIPKRLEKHLATHTEDRPNICEHCGKTFKLVNELNSHVQIHIFPEKFSCHICGKSFSSPFTVKDHIANIHLGHKKQFLCHLCCHVTADNRNLTLHLWQKHQIPVPKKCKLFKCDECDFETLRKHKFTVHKKLHTGVRDHVCEVCGKGYLTGGALRSHMLWHSDKIHQCTFESCSYSSPSKRQLDQHIRLMHTQRDMKPYACHLCSHRCSVRGNLDKHLRTVHSLNIPDKRRLSHLYNLGRCGRSRIPLSDSVDVPAQTLAAPSSKPSTSPADTHKELAPPINVPTTAGQSDAPGMNDFSVSYTWTNFQSYYQNMQY